MQLTKEEVNNHHLATIKVTLGAGKSRKWSWGWWLSPKLLIPHKEQVTPLWSAPACTRDEGGTGGHIVPLLLDTEQMHLEELSSCRDVITRVQAWIRKTGGTSQLGICTLPVPPARETGRQGEVKNCPTRKETGSRTSNHPPCLIWNWIPAHKRETRLWVSWWSLHKTYGLGGRFEEWVRCRTLSLCWGSHTLQSVIVQTDYCGKC